MKKNQNKIIIIFTFAIIFLSVFYYFENKTIDIKSNVKMEPRSEILEDKISEIEDELKENKDSRVIEEKETVSIIVLDKSYQIEIKNNETVYLAMKRLKEKDSNFSFNGKLYPSLGFFVDEINGAKNSLGSYWLYYVNGQEASIGISEYKLQNGDIISWKLE